MQISNKLKGYVKDSINFCNSNILITDTSTIKLAELLPKDVNKLDISSNLSNEILNLIDSWKYTNLPKSQLLLMMNDKECLNLFEKDTNQYSAQMIFPLYDANQLLGIIIFFRTNLNYIKSSIHSVTSFVKFANEFILEGD